MSKAKAPPRAAAAGQLTMKDFFFLVFACLWEHGWRLRCTHTMRSFTCVSVVVYVARKLRPCPSYSRRRDRINLVLWCSLDKGGGGTSLRKEEWNQGKAMDRTDRTCGGQLQHPLPPPPYIGNAMHAVRTQCPRSAKFCMSVTTRTLVLALLRRFVVP